MLSFVLGRPLEVAMAVKVLATSLNNALVETASARSVSRLEIR